MEKYNLPNNLKVFGVHVKTFPQGIGEAFDGLMKMLPPGDERPYYGISQCTKEGITYIAAALETFDGESKNYGYENYTIERGEYLTAPLMDWTSKLHCIKDVFEKIIKDERVDNSKPAIEVYKNMKEMVCMVKVDLKKEMLSEFDKATEQIKQQLSSLNEEQLNTVPFEGSWTAGQVARHLVMSHTGFAELLNGPLKETEREPDDLVATIKRDFSDFNIKMESPDFVRPENTTYQKEDLLHSFEDIRASTDKAIQTLDLSKTCAAFELPVYGFLTRLEAIWFVICHTQRHISQLKDIVQNIEYNRIKNNHLN